MNNLLRILTVHSAKDLLKYKSFFFLEKGFGWPTGGGLGRQTAEFVFSRLPEKLLHWLLDPRVLAIAAGLFLLKQVISLWPSSDMRRMHRKERGRYGVMEAFAALRWYQVAWDALAVGWVCALAAIWIGLAYLVGWGIWIGTGSSAALYFTAGLAAMAFPLVMAGFSYSSKLAVIRHGTFGARFRLFLELFVNWRLLW
ncbi:MAG: hypothetical protein P8X96_21745, partial [Desulfobacteraceae bacterium]